ncbi:MAG: hypothetical protein C0392_11515 [Syntrophus sp. (in: bacteria)]|nr:hypothetical protein [Syntrophus sp. (in: bacteria)]
MNIDLSKIGRILKEQREEQGRTIQEVSEVLCVRKSLIRAIEEGDWQMLPHQVYVRSYLKDYANFLHIYDEIVLFLNVPESKPEAVDTVSVPLRQKPVKQKPAHIKHDNSKREGPKEEKKRIGRFSRTTVAYCIILVIAATIFVYERIEKERALTPEVENASRVAVTSQANNENGSVSTINDVKRLMITCHERTWISVVIDEKEKKEFMLSPQEIIVLNAKEGFDILVGNAGGVKLLLNGKETEFTGKSGEVKRIKLS